MQGKVLFTLIQSFIWHGLMTCVLYTLCPSSSLLFSRSWLQVWTNHWQAPVWTQHGEGALLWPFTFPNQTLPRKHQISFVELLLEHQHVIVSRIILTEIVVSLIAQWIHTDHGSYLFVFYGWLFVYYICMYTNIHSGVYLHTNYCTFTLLKGQFL